ncbi:MAG: hypothetical protein M5U35_16850 [Roseovarius sp.]|nr:hypothetical protein [Roseovarius sp.]
MASVSALSACKEEKSYDVGYEDRSSVGYNTTCGFGIHPTHDDWNSPDHGKGYAEGMRDGILDCLKERRNQ